MKQIFRKTLPVILISLLVFALVGMSTGVASAAGSSAPSSPPSLWSCVESAPTCTVLFMAYVSSQIVGLLIPIAAWLIQIGLQLRQNVFNSPAVQAGFAECLSLANLGFVLLMIIIAVATITQREGYNYKKNLWRLVAMAILINFGLVICAPIVNFANGLTNYFMKSISGGDASITTFVNTLANQTSPAASDAPGGCNQATLYQTQHPGVLTPAQLQQICQANQGANASPATTFSQALLSLIFGTGFQLLIVIAFFAIGGVIIISYFWLTILLILLPFAWVTWIFPSYKAEFGKWWSKFIKWTFAPVSAMFFIWLALTIENSATYLQATGQTGVLGTQVTNSAASAIAAAIGQSTILNQFIINIVVLGVMVGGLVASGSLTGKVGNFVVKQGQATGKAVGGYASRRSKQAVKRAATAPLRNEKIRNYATKLQQQTGVRGFPARKIGQALESAAIAAGPKSVEEAGERFKGLTADQRVNRLSGVEFENAPAQRIALLKKILEDKNINKLSTDEMERYFGKDQEGAFKKYGQEKLLKDLRERSGLAFKYIDDDIDGLEKEVGNTEAGSRARKAAEEKLKDKTTEKNKMLASYIESDPEAAADIFNDPKKLEEKRKDAQAKTGRIPASLSDESLERMQKNIVQGMAKGLSTNNISTLMKSLAKKNNLEGLQTAADVNIKKTPQIQQDLKDNTKTLDWNDKQVGKGSLDSDLRVIFNVPKTPAQTQTATSNQNQNQQGQPRQGAPQTVDTGGH